MPGNLTPTKDDLMRRVAECYPDEDLSVVERAYDFAAEAHEGRKRYSGDPYITHPTAAAMILARIQLPLPVVVAGVLHDVLEDTPTSYAELREEFGEDVATMVSRVTKLGTVKYRGVDRYVENLRKMFIAMAADVRVVFIKFADRIHNLRTLDAVPEAKRRRIALESLELYAPIANRLGMGEIRGELEDLSFKYVYPKEYEWVTGQVAGRLDRMMRYVDEVKGIAKADLDGAGVEIVSMNGRTKHLYSLYRKLLNHERDLNRIYDLVAMRIVVPTVADCYAALGIIHSRWKPLKGRIKDYIAQPKPNGYQSLHTTVFCENGEIVEIQIRTPEMHRSAEYGIAAHWQYTEAGKRSKTPQGRELAWIKEFAKVQEEIEDQKQFMRNLDALKVDVFQNRIFVFTPKGDVFDLPEGATPVDFAFAIHTDVGNKCSAARVNGEMVSLDTELKSGDMVQITTDRNRKAPNQDWLKFVKTSNAKNKIKSSAKHGLTDWIRKVVAERTIQK